MQSGASADVILVRMTQASSLLAYAAHATNLAFSAALAPALLVYSVAALFGAAFLALAGILPSSQPLLLILGSGVALVVIPTAVLTGRRLRRPLGGSLAPSPKAIQLDHSAPALSVRRPWCRPCEE